MTHNAEIASCHRHRKRGWRCVYGYHEVGTCLARRTGILGWLLPYDRRFLA